ncbi:MAG: hypothetical protein IPG50_32975 [Myxococcales bacterium]|nr:hypothetical protein [Myxococcales bacterium]
MDLPSDDTLKHLVSRYGAFVAAHGAAIGKPALLLPTGEFFPDEFKGDADGVAAFLKRMLSYAPLSAELPVGLRFVEPEDGESGGGCGSGACSPSKKASCGPGESKDETPRGLAVHDAGEGYVVDLSIPDVGHSIRLAATLARAAGALVLLEAGEGDADDADVASEIAAVACGYGVLLLSGSYVYAKGCGGVRVHQSTTLAPAELGVLLALFVRAHGIKPGRARGQLEVTTKEAFDTALAWVDSNTDLVAALQTSPESLAHGLFTVGPTKSFLGRLFGKKSAEAPPPVAAAPRRQRSAEEERRIRESRALVEEALGKG